MSVGILLRQARESAGVSLEELAELTSIRRRVLSDLEVDNFETSGGLAYARGHIRSIAKVLHANGDLLVNEFNSMNQDFNRPMIELLSENSATTKPRRESRVSFALMAKAAAVIVALLIAVPTAASFIHSSKKSAKASTTASLSTQQSHVPHTSHPPIQTTPATYTSHPYTSHRTPPLSCPPPPGDGSRQLGPDAAHQGRDGPTRHTQPRQGARHACPGARPAPCLVDS